MAIDLGFDAYLGDKRVFHARLLTTNACSPYALLLNGVIEQGWRLASTFSFVLFVFVYTLLVAITFPSAGTKGRE